MTKQKITQIDAYRKEPFAHPLRNGHVASHDVYTRGDGQKVVIVIQELPGIGQETLALADRFVDRGFTVVLPHLFGPIGKTSVVRNLLQVFCLRKEFALFSSHDSSPIVDYLAGLCTLMKTRHQVPGVAVIGMCLTGNFAISLMATEAVLAGFASQPSLPITQQAALHLPPAEIAAAKDKLDRVGPMHCGRFQGDGKCTAQRFNALDKTFNKEGRERIIFHELPGNGHSILTLDFVDEAGHPTKKVLDEIFGYFAEQLRA